MFKQKGFPSPKGNQNANVTIIMTARIMSVIPRAHAVAEQPHYIRSVWADMLQGPQWTPESKDNTKTSLYTGFSYAYIPMVKFNL